MINMDKPSVWTKRKRWAGLISVMLLLMLGLAGGALAQSGNISPLSIEIDSPSANLYISASPPANTVDWVKDSLANTDPVSLSNSVASGINTTVGLNQTGAVAMGHWYGVRIVDGLDQ